LTTIEEARARVPHSQRIYLEKVWNEAVSGNSRGRRFVKKIKTELLSEINKLLDKPISSNRMLIELNDVRHMRNNHGEGKVSPAKEFPITKETFTLIPDILDNYDSVSKGHRTSYYNPKKGKYEPNGAVGVLIGKNYSNGTAVVVSAVPTYNGDIVIRTFRIDKK
jgi:hypothetical protein